MPMTLTLETSVVDDAYGVDKAVQVYSDPNRGNAKGGVVGLISADGTFMALGDVASTARGSYPATGLLSDTADLPTPGFALEIWSPGTIKFTCVNGMVDTRTIVSVPYQLPVAVKRIWSTTYTSVTDSDIHVLC